MVKSVCHAGDAGSIPELGKSPGGGHGNPLQYSCLENSMDRGVWQAVVVHRVSKIQVRLKQFSAQCILSCKYFHLLKIHWS